MSDFGKDVDLEESINNHSQSHLDLYNMTENPDVGNLEKNINRTNLNSESANSNVEMVDIENSKGSLRKEFYDGEDNGRAKLNSDQNASGLEIGEK